MKNSKFVVYQHINLKTKEIFYIGCGEMGREIQFGKQQRTSLWNLYVKNNQLNIPQYFRSDNKEWSLLHHNETHNAMRENIKVKIISSHVTLAEAQKVEADIISSNYGKPGYKLVNTNMGAVYNPEKLHQRGVKVSLAISIPVINMVNNKRYKSAAEAAKITGINRCTITKQCIKNQENILANKPLLFPRINRDSGLSNGVWVYA